jgi:hypothetical protein
MPFWAIEKDDIGTVLGVDHGRGVAVVWFGHTNPPAATIDLQLLEKENAR